MYFNNEYVFKGKHAKYVMELKDVLFERNVDVLLLAPILDVYNLSQETSRMARDIIIYHGVMGMLIWPLSFTLPNTLRACNDVKFCMIVCIVSMWIFRIGFSYIVGKFMGWGVFGVWVAMTIDWAVRSVFFVWRYLSGRWKLYWY